MVGSKTSPSRRVPWTAWTTVAVVLVAVGCAARKASSTAITTDEAYNFNEWVTRGPLHIWSDYTAPNNHMLHTVSVWLSTQAFGTEPWALRLSSVCGFALQSCCVALIAHRVIERPWMRPVAVGFVALHPYVVDFGALARGYTLGTSFVLLGVWSLMRAMDSVGSETRVRRALSLAGIAFAAANGVIPLMAHATIGAGLAYAYLDLRRVRLFKAIGRLLSLIVPASLCLGLLYSRVFQRLRPETFRFGASSVRESLISLHKLFVYEPQARVTYAGTPVLDGVSLHSWHHGLLPEAFGALFSSWLGVATLTLCVGMAILGGLLPARTPSQRTQQFVGLMVVSMTLSTVAQVVIAHARPPVHRTWFPLMVLVLFGAWIAASRAVERLPVSRQRYFAFAFGPLALAFGLQLVDRISLAGFREWPDNAPIPRLLAYVADARQGRPVRVGYPWYQEACLLYYRTQRGYDWLALQKVDKQHRGTSEFMIVNSYLTASRYPKHQRVLRDEPFLVELLHRGPSQQLASSP